MTRITDGMFYRDLAYLYGAVLYIITYLLC